MDQLPELQTNSSGTGKVSLSHMKSFLIFVSAAGMSPQSKSPGEAPALVILRFSLRRAVDLAFSPCRQLVICLAPFLKSFLQDRRTFGGADEFISKMPLGYDTMIEERGAIYLGGSGSALRLHAPWRRTHRS